MHGNTQTTASGIKTRRFDDILSELERASTSTPRTAATSAACTSSSPARTSPSASAARAGSAEADLDRDYRSQVDPRLNYEQALEMALLVGRKMGSLAAQAVRV